tara:strand:- start:377 stop:535 length:159 start_codon:yes stop_codon:yes gene_type:complete
MEEIQERLELIIDDFENHDDISKAELLSSLYKLKTEIEDYNLKYEEDVDYYK